MSIKPFKLERYFAQYEFNTKYLLSSSDCESLWQTELLRMASPDLLALWDNLKLGYTESSGHPLLRAAVSNGYAQIKPEDTLIAAPEEAIFIVMQTLLRPGDQVITVAPTYQSLHEIARSIGCQLTHWELELTAQGWTIDLKKLENSLSDKTRLLVLNFPNNPTGFIPSRTQLDQIISIADKHGVYVFSDEMYRLLEFDRSLRLPSICDIYERGISLSGLSKSFSLPGLRIGWLATQISDFIDEWLRFKDYTTICNSAPSEILALIALQNTDRIVTRNLEIIQGNIQLANQFFARYIHLIDWRPPQAGSISFPRWLGPGSVEDLCQTALHQQGIMIVPGSLFDFQGNHFRIGLGRNNFGEALEHLEDVLSTIK